MNIEDVLAGRIAVIFDEDDTKEGNIREFQNILHERGITWIRGASLLELYYFDKNLFRISEFGGLCHSAEDYAAINYTLLKISDQPSPKEELFISLKE